jgi:hypothetical protein
MLKIWLAQKPSDLISASLRTDKKLLSVVFNRRNIGEAALAAFVSD